MNIKFKWEYVVILTLVFLVFRSCNKTKAIQKELDTIDVVVHDTIEHYKTELGELVVSRAALKGENLSLQQYLIRARDSTDLVKRQLKNFKKVSAAVRTVTEVRMDTIEIPYEIPGDGFNVPFNKIEPFYSLSGRSTNRGLYIDEIIISNTQSIMIGDKKEGFWRSEFKIEVINSNPHIITTSVESFVLSQRKKRFGIGAFFGYGIASDGLSPIIGIGVSYDFIRF